LVHRTPATRCPHEPSHHPSTLPSLGWLGTRSTSQQQGRVRLRRRGLLDCGTHCGTHCCTSSGARYTEYASEETCHSTRLEEGGRADCRVADHVSCSRLNSAPPRQIERHVLRLPLHASYSNFPKRLTLVSCFEGVCDSLPFFGPNRAGLCAGLICFLLRLLGLGQKFCWRLGTALPLEAPSLSGCTEGFA